VVMASALGSSRRPYSAERIEGVIRGAMSIRRILTYRCSRLGCGRTSCALRH